jgi:hypothetical protein
MDMECLGRNAEGSSEGKLRDKRVVAGMGMAGARGGGWWGDVYTYLGH